MEGIVPSYLQKTKNYEKSRSSDTSHSIDISEQDDTFSSGWKDDRDVMQDLNDQREKLHSNMEQLK